LALVDFQRDPFQNHEASLTGVHNFANVGRLNHTHRIRASVIFEKNP
jgi:hypothetical protein